MRNLIEYPITSQEVVEALDRAYNDYVSKQSIGGNDGYILYTVKHLLETNKEFLATVVGMCAGTVN